MKPGMQPVEVCQLNTGDRVDLENDEWADVPVSMFEPSRFAAENSTVVSIAPDDDDWVMVTFDNATVAFPPDHLLPLVVVR